jgi:hypothetical protein
MPAHAEAEELAAEGNRINERGLRDILDGEGPACAQQLVSQHWNVIRSLAV